MIPCPECDHPCSNDHGLGVHIGIHHKELAAILRGAHLPPPPDPPDPPDPNAAMTPVQVSLQDQAEASSLSEVSISSDHQLTTSVTCRVRECGKQLINERARLSHRSTHPTHANQERLRPRHLTQEPASQETELTGQANVLATECQQWTRRFKAILDDIGNFDYNIFDSLVTELAKFLFTGQ